MFKYLCLILVAYVCIVATFESLLGVFQPANQSTLVITTADENGMKNDRVVSRLESSDQLYVAANHWPRAWYKQTLGNPNVEIRLSPDSKEPYVAVPVTDPEHARVNNDYPLGLGFRILTGFPPRKFLRLDRQ
ncbi:MAG: hypothetical protein ACI8XZ_001241 [Gammaproteobacteria bacterium]|jgi:hypothetical protein